MDKDENKKAYGEEFEDEPPLIDLSKISDSVPISLFVGENDELATIYSNDLLFEAVGNKTIFSYEVLPNFGHTTFNYGKNKTYLSTISEQL